MAQTILPAALLYGAVHAGPDLRDCGLVRDRRVRHSAGGSCNSELREAEDHPGVSGPGLLWPGREEGRERTSGEIR